MGYIRLFALVAVTALVFSSGCAQSRKNLYYDPGWGAVERISRPVKGVIVPVADLREKTLAYPKQIIIHTDYSGDVSYDINDRAVDEVFEEAVAAELGRLGVKVMRVSGVQGPLDKNSAAEIRKTLNESYPEAQVAFGVKIKDFTATSQRTLIASNVKVTGWMELTIMDLQTGDVLWADYKTQWDDTVARADHNYMVEELDKALYDLMKKGLRGNVSLREMLVKISNR